MTPRKLAFVLGVVFGLVSMQSHAAAQFPAEIAACVASTACSPPLVIGASATTAAFSYTQGTEQRYLLSYTLGAASHANGTLLTDHMWVGVSAAYDLATALHPISLYFDRVTPTPPNLWIGDSDGLDVQVALTSAALLAGQGHYSLADGFEAPSITNMSTIGDGSPFPGPGGLQQAFVPCAAATCAVEAHFNLVGYHFMVAGGTAAFVLDLLDPQSLIYLQTSDYAGGSDPFHNVQAYSTVPLMPTLYLLPSGLYCIWRRRKPRGGRWSASSPARDLGYWRAR